MELSRIEENEIDEIVSLISKYFKEDKKLILETLYINIVIKLIRYIKNKHNNKIISYNIEVSKKILQYI